MEIIVGKNSGFCFGVKRAVEGVEKEVEKYKKIKCLGNIVHNETVVSRLEQKGVEFIRSIDEARDNEILAIRAHGVDEATYKRAEEKKLKVLDYTCPKVDMIHRKIKEASEKGYQVIIIGKKTHPEVIGSKGYSASSIVIEDMDEIDMLPDFNKVFSIVQTTFSYDKYIKMEEKLKEKYKDIIRENTICPSTKNRQEECRQIAKKVEYMIIIGGKESSNTHKLYEVAMGQNKNCALIQDENDKIIEEIAKYDIIGIMSGASTPNDVVDRVISKLKSFKGEK